MLVEQRRKIFACDSGGGELRDVTPRNGTSGNGRPPLATVTSSPWPPSLREDRGTFQVTDPEKMLDVKEHAMGHGRGSSGIFSSETDGVPSAARQRRVLARR